MRLVVADTSPVRYLIQIGQIGLLAELFERVILPVAVAEELRHPSAPPAVREWALASPGWIDILEAPELDDPMLKSLDAGERAAIAVAISVNAHLVLIDDRKGAAAATRSGLEVTGTLGVLDLAAERKLIHLADALTRLQQTNFRYRPELLNALLRKHKDE